MHIPYTETTQYTKYYATKFWPEIYADWINNFTTVARFIEYYGMSDEHAADILAMGRATDNFSRDWAI